MSEAHSSWHGPLGSAIKHTFVDLSIEPRLLEEKPVGAPTQKRKIQNENQTSNADEMGSHPLQAFLPFLHNPAKSGLKTGRTRLKYWCGRRVPERFCCWKWIRNSGSNPRGFATAQSWPTNLPSNRSAVSAEASLSPFWLSININRLC